MSLGARLVFSIGLMGFLYLALPRSLRADTVYTYTGNPYTYCDGTYCSGPTPSLSITVDIAAGTQLDNLYEGPLLNGLPDPVNPDGDLTQYVSGISITDGTGLSITTTNDLYFNVSTDMNGNIVAWALADFSTDAAGQIDESVFTSSSPCYSNLLITESPLFAVLGACDLSATGTPGTDIVGYGVNEDPGTWTMSTPASVPEPATASLVFCGLGVIFVFFGNALWNRPSKQSPLRRCGLGQVSPPAGNQFR